MRWNIRTQLLVPLLLLLIGVVVVGAWLAISSGQRIVQEQIEVQLRQIAKTISNATYPFEKRIDQMKELSGVDLHILKDNTTYTTLDDPPNGLPAPESLPERWQALRLGPTITSGKNQYLSSGVRVVQHRPDGKVIPVTVYLLYPEAQWREAFWQAITPSLWWAIIGSLLAMGIAVYIAFRLGRRIMDIQKQTKQIAEGDFSPMPLTGRKDELWQLGKSINDMAQQLAQLQETVKMTERFRLLGQVSGGLAHQLRNLATGARLAVQVHAGECNKNQDEEALSVALRQLTLMEEKLHRFLDLGQLEETQRQPCNLSYIIDEAVELLRPQCKHAHIDLRWESPGNEHTVAGDASQLSHLLINVISNAIEAAGSGGWVEIFMNTDRSQDRVQIEVRDSGTGPSNQITERLFEPFATDKPDGVGLGLAVAKQVAESHGGKIWWQQDAGHTCFMIELPYDVKSMEL